MTKRRAGAVLLVMISAGAALVGRAVIAQEQSPPGAPTFYHDIQPIFAQHCVTCHTDGGIGPFDLRSPDVAYEGAPKIAEAVSEGVMPPWMPGADSPPIVGERKLTPDEIGRIVAWAEAGAPLGDSSEAVHVEPVAVPEVRADLTVEMPASYTPDDSLTDDYRCFLIDADLPADRFYTGFTVQPGQPRIVHHVLLFQIDESAREAALARDSEDERPGWQCFGGAGVGAGRVGLSGTVGSWTPGSLPTVYPEGTGRLLRADGLIVMQVHYNLEAGAAPDQTRVSFQLADVGADLTPLSIMPLWAPVEIPCPAGVGGAACDRATAIAEAVAVEGSRANVRVQALLAWCGKTVDDYMSQDTSQLTSSCDFTMNRDVLALGVVGHMHLRGATITIERNPDAPDATVLLNIPRWDFHWQGGYEYVEPVRLAAGDVVRITCAWDNGDGERYIVWGEGTRDEMCLGALVTRPA